jgi:hypothetical protein
VPYSTPAEKEKARQQNALAERIGGAVAVAVRGLAVIAAGRAAGAVAAGQTAAAAAAAPSAAVLIACLLLVEKMFELWARDTQRIVNDPAQPDFRTRTRAQPRPLYPWVFGVSVPEQAATSAATELNQASAQIRAMVTARERAWGARDRDESDWEALQLRSAADFASSAAADLRTAAERIVAFASALEASQFRAVLREREEIRAEAELLPRGDQPLELLFKQGPESYLPAESLALLYGAGVRIETLRRPPQSLPRSSDPLGDTASRFREARQPLGSFAATLDAVSPEPPFHGD